MTPAKRITVLAAVFFCGALIAGALLAGRVVWLLLVPTLVLLVWAVRSPYRCLLLVLFSFPLERFGTIPTPWFNIKPFQLLAALTLLAVLVQHAMRRESARLRFPRDPILACYLAFLAANAVCFAVSGNPDDMRAIFHYLMFALIAALTVLLVRTPAQLAGATRAIALSGALAGLLGLAQYSGYLAGLDTGVQETRMEFHSGESAALRVASTYFDANLFASFLCFALPLGLAWTQSVASLLPRMLTAAGVLGMLIALAFTQSRSGFFGVAAGCAVFLLAQRRLRTLGRAVLIAALLAALGWTALSLYGSEWYSPEMLLNRVLAYDQGVSDRSTAWKQILEAFYDHPIFGVGPAQAANWSVYIPNWRSNWTFSNWRIVAHNIFVDVAVGTGLLGLAPFVLFVALLVWRAWRNLRVAPPDFSAWDAGLFAALASVLVNSLSMTTLMYPFLWTLTGLVVAAAAMHYAPVPGRTAVRTILELTEARR